MQKVIAILIVGVLLTSCGSIRTLSRSEQAIKTSLVKGNTKCTYIPYVYSGVAYDFCMLNAEYRDGATYPGGSHGAADMIAFVALDAVLSGVIDTFALPYTVPMQDKHGSILIK